MLPREKLLKGGVSVLSDIQLIQILVGSGIKGRDFKQISKSILKVIRSNLKERKDISLETLINQNGVGEVVGMRVLAGIELGRRLYGLFDNDVFRITDSQSAYNILRDMSKLKRERVDILCLNSRFDLVSRESIALGSLNCANLSPREVIYTAVISNCAFVILAHNHPSGDSTPSEEDIKLTKTISDTLDLVGIQLLDHIVVGKNSWKSISV